jgi:hypothetical protein
MHGGLQRAKGAGLLTAGGYTYLPVPRPWPTVGVLVRDVAAKPTEEQGSIKSIRTFVLSFPSCSDFPGFFFGRLSRMILAASVVPFALPVPFNLFY